MTRTPIGDTTPSEGAAHAVRLIDGGLVLMADTSTRVHRPWWYGSGAGTLSPEEVTEMIVVAGVDGSKLSVAVARHALQEATYRDAELHVVHVFHAAPVFDAAYGVIPRDLDQLAAADRRHVWGPIELMLELAPVPTKRVDLEGYPPDSLAAYVGSVDADLLVVGSRGRGDLASLILGSTSLRAIHLARCDVLVVKPPRAA